MNRSYRLVVNPAAGGGRAERQLPTVTAALTAVDVQHEVTLSRSLEHAVEVAVAAVARDETVVAVGGDGMVGALAGVVADVGGTFGIIPAGRGNDFARTLELPVTPDGAARVLAAGRERPVDLIAVGRADAGPPPDGDAPAGPGETIVAGSVYLGIPAVAGQIAATASFPPGTLAYPVAALRAVAGWRKAAFRLELDGEEAREFSGGAVVVANSRYFGAGMMVAPDADTGDGLLDVVYIHDASKLAMIRALSRIRQGSHTSMRPVGTARSRVVTVTTGRATPGGADGETLACAQPLEPGVPLRIRALPGVLRMIA